MIKRELLYQGKAKSLYKTDDPTLVIMHFRDDTSAFDGQRVEKLTRKGLVNNHFNAFIMQYLTQAGIPTQFKKLLSDTDALVTHLTMIPIECVVRNRAAGGLCRRLGVESGLVLTPPMLEFFLKNDALHDPLVTQDHILRFSWATQEEIEEMSRLSFKVNDILSPLFEVAGLILVDFKLEFGHVNGQIVLGDEFTPDGCRIWDKATQKSLDKDRFRKELGSVIESYEEVAHRLGIQLPTA